MFRGYTFDMNATRKLMEKREIGEVLDGVQKAVAAGPLALALIDLDDFGSINDSQGHQAGDRVLAAFERTLTGSIGPDHEVWRIGGDEYAVLAPGGSAEALLIVMEEVRTHVEKDPAQPVGLSVGVAALPAHAPDAAELLKAAGHALFRAKRGGGHQVAIYVEEKMVLKSNYYEPAALHRLSRLSERTGRTEASLLREALDDLLAKLDVK